MTRMTIVRGLLYVLLPCALAVHVVQARADQKIDAVPGSPVTATGILDKAPYRIDIPGNWNHQLVMLLHGYEPKGSPRAETLAQNEATPVFLERGYAVAQSAYSTQGWATAEAVPDTERLRAHFVEKYGKPRHTYIVGFSLGGQGALASMERHGAGYDGALSLCGVNVSTRQALEEAVVTTLVAFDYFFPDTLGLAPHGLTDPASPPMVDPQAIEMALQKNEKAAAILSTRLEVPRAGLAGAVMLDYLVLREFQARAGGHPVDNSATVYKGFGDDAAFNKGVRRYKGDAKAMQYVAANAVLTGRIDKPIVLFSNEADPTVPKRFGTAYPALVKQAGRSEDLMVLPRVGEGHCDFTPAQIGSAFSTLTGWVDSGKRPTP